MIDFIIMHYLIKKINFKEFQSNRMKNYVDQAGQDPSNLDHHHHYLVYHKSLKFMKKICKWEISIRLAKNIGKYHVCLWSSQVKILDLSQVAEGHEWCSNIFSQVMTITTSDIFQYFCQPCNNHGHKYVFHKITHEYYYHTIFNCNIKIILYLRQIPQDTQNQI